MTDQIEKAVLILGARGRLGCAAARAFAAAGWRVQAQMRAGAVAPDVKGVTWLPASVQDTEALAQAAASASVVLHAINPIYTDWARQALPLLDAGLRVTDRLGATLMLPGNVYNFGARMPSLLTEHTPQLADTRKGRIRIAMERRLQQTATGSGPRSVVIRAGDFFGSGTGSWFDLVLAKDIARAKITLPDGADVASAWAYLPDLAQAFVRVAERIAAAPAALAPFEVFHFAGHTLSGRDWIALLQDVALEQGWLAPGRTLAVGALPWPLLKLGSVFVPMWRELLEMRYLWRTPHTLAGDKLAALIGPEPRTPLPLAVRQALHDLGLARALAGDALARA